MTQLYATWDPAALGADLELEQTNAVLTFSAAADLHRSARAIEGKSFGAWFAEMLVWGDDDPAGAVSLGIAKAGASLAEYVGGDASGYGYRPAAGEIHNAGASVASVATAAKGDTIGILVNLVGSAPTVSWYSNGVLLKTIALPDFGPWYLAATVSGADAYGLRCFLNTGARAFDYANGSADGWYSAGDAPASVLLASEDWMTAPDDDPANVRFDGRVATNGDLLSVRSLDFWPWQRGIDGQTAMIDVLDPDGTLDELLTHDARDLAVAVSEILRGDSYADRADVAQLAIDGVQAIDDATLRLNLRDAGSVLDQPAQRRLISPAADPAAANKPWPVCLGACRTVEPVLIDAASLTYAVHDGQVLGLGYVRDMGDPLDPSATPADYQATADKSGIALHVAPAGKLTVDASSVGGAGLPDATDDVLGGAGAPFTGADDAPPTGFDDTGSNQTGGAPVMKSGKLVFPRVQVSPTIKVSGWMELADGFGGGAGAHADLRISWRDETGAEIDFSYSTLVTIDTAWAQYTFTGTGPAGAVRASIEAAVGAHETGVVRVDDFKAWYVTDDGDVELPLRNPDFEDGDTGWYTTSGAGWAIKSAGDGHTGSWYAEKTATAQPDEAIRNDLYIPTRPAATVSWAGITTTKLGAGKSYQLQLVIPSMPDVDGDTASQVGIATGTTPDTYLWSTTAPGTYSIPVTNTTGADVDLYLLAVVAGDPPEGEGVTVDSFQVLQYDDTYVPPIVGDPSAPSDLAPIKLADLLTELLDVRRADLGVAWSKDDATAIDTDTGYAGVGLHFADGETLRDITKMALDSYTACAWPARDGTLRMTRLTAPEGVAEADRSGSLDQDAMREDLLMVPDLAPGLTTQIGVRRNWSPYGDSDFVSNYTSVPLELRRALKAEFQETRATSAALSSAYAHARLAPAFASILDDPDDGQAEVDRIGALYTKRRAFYQVKLELDAVPDIELGQVWTLTYPRYGLDAGKAVMVVDLIESRLARTIDAVLWG